MTAHRAASDPPHLRFARFAIAALLVAVPFVFVPTADEAFRLPKLLASESLGLLSLIALAFGLRHVDRVTLGAIWRLPAVRASLPLLVLALLSLATTDYPSGVRLACASLAIGTGCLVGWSAGVDEPGRQRLLRLLILPACALGLLALLQLSGIYRPFGLVGGAERSREGITSLAGNAGDLGAYLVLPSLLLQAAIATASGMRRWLLGGALALCVCALAATQTFTALIAAVVASLLFWGLRLPLKRTLIAGGVALLIGAGLIAVIPQLRARTTSKLTSLAQGDWDQFLTYRLDGWRAAVWMLERHPVTGVGHGAYRSQYAAARIDRVEHGATYEGRYRQLSFFNAHNDALEIAAELGWPGVAALGWAIWVVIAAARRLAGAERALAAAGLLAMAVLAAGGFPFETALIAYPWLLFLSGVLAPATPAPEVVAVEQRSAPAAGGRKTRR